MNNWIISSVKAKVQEGDLQNVIHTVHWRLQKTDGEFTSDVYGSKSLPAPSPESFIPSDEVTKDLLISWLEASFEAEELESLNTNLDNQLELKKNPTEVDLIIE